MRGPGTNDREMRMQPTGKERARQTLRAILTGPANFIDTSRNYGFGRSEERIGAALREMGGKPQGFVLSTKLDRDSETNRFDADVARRSLETSLKALGVDQIDLLHLHDPEHAESIAEITGPNGAIEALFKMKEQGLAKAVGLAAGKVDVMLPMLKAYDFDALITHNRFTLVNRNAEEMIDYAHGKGIAVLNAAPYGEGFGFLYALCVSGGDGRHAEPGAEGGGDLPAA